MTLLTILAAADEPAQSWDWLSSAEDAINDAFDPIASAVGSVVFATAHFATDPWLISYYFVFGLSLAMLAWRTRGLEMSIVVHAVNNVWMMVGALLIARTRPPCSSAAPGQEAP